MRYFYRKSFFPSAILFLLIGIGHLFAQPDAASILVHPVVPPLNGEAISCNDQSILFNIVPGGATGMRILVLHPSISISESPEGYAPADWGRFADTLLTLGFSVNIVPSSTNIATLLPDNDIFILYGTPGRLLFPDEVDSITSFLNAGGGILSVIRAPAGDISELDIHNPILSLAGLSYVPPRLSFYDTIAPGTSAQVVEGIGGLSTYKPMSISAAAHQQVALTPDGDCICAADTSLGGRLFVSGEERFFSNGPLTYGGISVDWDAFDNKPFILNVIYWLAMGRTRPGCGIDSTSIVISIDGVPYGVASPELSWDGHNLRFSPFAGFWTSGIHSISLDVSDSCGHDTTYNFSALFDVDKPYASLTFPPSGILISSGDSVRFSVSDDETGLDTFACYFTIDGFETITFSEAASIPGFAVLPLSGWSVGLHEICIYAQDSPQYCAPNILDTCVSITLTEDTLWSEMTSLWQEGCSLVYTEICVHSAHRYVKDLYLDNFAFYENNIPVLPPSLEILNTCPSESAKVDIVILFDFSTSMDSEVVMFFGAIPSFVTALGTLNYRIACVVFNGCPGEFDGVWLIVRTNFGGPCTYNAAYPNWWAINPTEFNCLYNAVVNDLYTWPPGSRGSGMEDQYGAIVRANENLDFRPDALKSFILFTDERPIVTYALCDPDYDETAAGLDSIIRYCIDNDIVVLPVTPEDGNFAYMELTEDPERAFYQGYPILADTTGGRWFHLYMSSYDSLATQIGIAINNLPCCYMFRYREEQFCNTHNLLAVDIFDEVINYGRVDTTYVPPCPGFGEFIFPEICGGITTCPRQWLRMQILSDNPVFALEPESLLFGVSGFGIFDLDNAELQYSAPLLEFNPSTDYDNGDTICALLLRAYDTLGCQLAGDTCCFIVDLQPPIFFELFPPPYSVMESTDFTISMMIYDSIAGVRWSETGNDKFTVIINGDTVICPIYSEHPYIFIEPPIFHNCDSVTICANNIPDNPDYNYCEPNRGDTCWSFTVFLREGPIAVIVQPPPQTVSACREQEIWLTINDSDGVDSSTITIVIAGDTFVCADDELSFRNDTLFFVPPTGFWADGETVTVFLIKADDIYGTSLQNSPLHWTFYMDFSPPVAQMISPAESSFTLNYHQPIHIEIEDNIAGIFVDSSNITIAGRDYALSELLTNISSDSLSATLVYDPNRFGISWYPGDTIDISLSTCDAPDTCALNCEQYFWVFYLPPPYDCARKPNPFTPNSDRINDWTQFTFPGLVYKDAKIHIFNLYNILVTEINVPSGLNANSKEIARWDGLDKNGRPVPQGLYIYVIEIDGEVICEGTVTIAR